MRWLKQPLHWHWLLLLTLSAAVFLSGLDTPGLYTNEGRYAGVAWEMIERGDWVSPRLNGVPYFEKPPLLYWLVAASYKLFGVSETSARLPVALSALAGVLCTYGIGRILFTPRAGLLAALALATSFGYFIFARIILIDLLFTACVTAAFWCFLRGYLHPERRGSYLLVYLFSGLAVLAKGLLGLVIPGLVIGGVVGVTHDWKLLKELRLPLGAVLFLAVAAPWHLAMGRANEEFFWFYFVNEHVLRFLNKRHLIDYAPLPLGLFLLMVLVWSFPWGLLLPFAGRQFIPPERDTRRGRAAWIIPCWVIAVLGFFAITPARLEYYSLPVLPAFALWVGRFWDDALADPKSNARVRWALAGLLVLSAGLIPLGAILSRLKGLALGDIFFVADEYSRMIRQGILVPPASYALPSLREFPRLLVLTAGLLLIGPAVALLASLLGRSRLAFACLTALMLGIFLVSHRGIVLFEPHASVRELAMGLNRAQRPGDVAVVEGPYENFAALNVYTRRSALVLNGRFGDLEFGSHRPEAVARFLDDEAFNRLWGSETRVFLLTTSASRVGALREQNAVVILGRSGYKWLLVNRR